MKPAVESDALQETALVPAPPTPQLAPPAGDANALFHASLPLRIALPLYVMGAIAGALVGPGLDTFWFAVGSAIHWSVLALGPAALMVGLRLANPPSAAGSPGSAALRSAFFVAPLLAVAAMLPGAWGAAAALAAAPFFAWVLQALQARSLALARPDTPPWERAEYWRRGASWLLRGGLIALIPGLAAAILLPGAVAWVGGIATAASWLALAGVSGFAALELRAFRTWWPGRDGLDRLKIAALAQGWIAQDDAQLPTRSGAPLALAFAAGDRALETRVRVDRLPAVIEATIPLPALAASDPGIHARSREVADGEDDAGDRTILGDLILDRLLHVSGVSADRARALLAEQPGLALSVLHEHPGSELQGGALTLRIDADRDSAAMADGVKALLAFAEALEERAVPLSDGSPR